MTTNAKTKRTNLIDDLLSDESKAVATKTEDKNGASESTIENLLQLRVLARDAKLELESAQKDSSQSPEDIDALKVDYMSAGQAFSDASKQAKPVEVAEMDRRWNNLRFEAENAQPAPLPPIDIKLYEAAVIASGSEWNPDNENTSSPDDTRSDFFQEAIGTADYIRKSEANLSSLKEKDRQNIEKELKQKTVSLQGFLVNTFNFFGKPSAEYLRGELLRFGFEFDDEYVLTAKAGETELKTPVTETQPTTENITEKITVKKSVDLPIINSPAEYREIDRRLIKPSGTNPRRNFNLEELKELAESIARVGVQQPIVIRPLKEMPEDLAVKFHELVEKNDAARKAQDTAQKIGIENPGDKTSRDYARLTEKYSTAEGNLRRFVEKDLTGYGFELIAGERRWRASAMAGRDLVPCMVRSVSDTEAFEIQIIENLQRKDIEPLDEAFGYKNLMDKGAFSINEIALRVGKSEAFIHQRLKLNDLIPAAQKDLASGKLPIGHALEIAKYSPEVQKDIHKDHLYDWDGVESFSNLKKSIERHVLTLLKRAPFSLKATNLRADGLACIDCPQRSGANPTLFDSPKPEEDACLNKKCFEGKTLALIQLSRAEITTQVRNEKGDKNYSAPVILNHYGSSEKFPEALKYDQYRKIENQKSACRSSETAIYLDSDRIAQKQLICRDKNCTTHNSSGSMKTPEKLSEDRLIRKEELFDYRAGKIVQKRVLMEAMPKLEQIKSIKKLPEDKWFDILLARLWRLQAHNDSNVMEVIREIMQTWTDEKIPTYFSSDEKDRIKALSLFTPGQRIQMMFLFLHAHRGGMFYESYVSQKEVRALAEEYGVNYRLIDAEERFNLTQTERQYKKHAPVFKEYLDEVAAGKNVKLPRVWSTKYKAKD